MVAIEEGPIRRFRCHTGHGFTAGALSDRAVTQIEKTLWAALAQLEEHGRARPHVQDSLRQQQLTYG